MDDYYCVEELSDREAVDSSDDEDFRSLFTFDDSEEDFETEMERERQQRVNRHNTAITSNTSNAVTDGSVANQTDVNEAKNDELLYDPQSDEKDQKWVDRESATTGVATDGRSDATLNCPACLTVLCRDCQRHDIYRTQYRAMFATNCRIDFTQRLQYKDKQKSQKRKRNETTDQTNDEKCHKVDNYYAVFCTVCNTRVAVYDSEEVYHFFSVLASF